jgi:hypothetical protein
MFDEEFGWQRFIKVFMYLHHRLKCVLGVEEGFGDCVALGH